MSNCLCHADDCLLCEAHLHEGLSDAQACEIQGLLRRSSMQPQETIFRQGDASDWLYIVRAGQLKISVNGADGREQIMRIAVAGQLIGYDTVEDLHHPYTATALTAVRLCGIRHRDLLRVLEQNLEVSRRMVQLLNQELSQAQVLIHILGQKSSAEKIAAFLLSLIPEQGRPEPEAAIPLPLSRREMADMLGLTVETVSRLMAELRRERVIEAPRGYIHILDRKRLHAYAGPIPLAANRGLLRPAD
jgi:CRP/FNR family transcriptional regulator